MSSLSIAAQWLPPRGDCLTATTDLEWTVEVKVKVTLRLTVSQYVLVSSTLVRLVTRYYFLSECCCQLRSCFCGAPSLMRGWVCNLQCNHSMI
jgi:hypothetical protein